MPSTAEWLIVRTQPRREFWAAENVRRQGYAFYLPQIFNQRFLRREPLFPSYLFVNVYDRIYSWLRGTFGVSHVIMHGPDPAIVRDAIIDELHKRENKHGVIELPKPTRFRKGDKVHFRYGAFASDYRVAIYDGQAPQQRVRVLLEMLGQHVPVVIDPSQLAPMAH